MIQCTNVGKSYQGKQILSNLTLSIEEPKIIGLVGHNGAGKSTLLRLLAGRLKPNEGKSLVAKQNTFHNLTLATNSVFVEESMSFPSHITLKENLRWAKRFYPNWQSELAKSLCEYAQIDLNSYYNLLSKGQAATFRLIFGLCARCMYTYLDEPMNGMDEGIRSDFYRVILKEFIEQPRFIIISTHYLNEIRHLVEEVILLHDGRILKYTTMDDLAVYAVQVNGQKSIVEEAISGATVLKIGENNGFYEAYVVKSEFDFNRAEALDLQARPVEANVVIQLLTSNRQGGIDDVYK